MKQSLSQSSFSNRNSLKRPLSASATNITVQKREKLKKLLVEKFVKKFEANDQKLIEKEVGIFIQKEKLTENDLKAFEVRLSTLIMQKKDYQNLKENIENDNHCNHKEEYEKNSQVKNNNYFDDTRSIHSHMSLESNLSKKFADKVHSGIKYEEITSFELRKLLENERKPVVRQRFDHQGDEWSAIGNLKKKQWEDTKKDNKLKDIETKTANRMTFDSQIQEKQMKKEVEKKSEDNFHRTMLGTVDKLTRDEMRKESEIRDKKLKERELRDIQIQQNIEKKKNEFVNSRSFDNQLINKVLTENEKQKQRELEKKIEAKQNLTQMLKENEEYKQRQKDEFRKEREQDIKFMDDYTKILEKQEQDRSDYFKRCGNRQKEAMNRMAETIIKQQDLKAKEDEEKMRRYQEEKEKRDQEEEERRKQVLKDSKSHMRGYLTNQMVEKKQSDQIVKKIEDEQVKMWNQENDHYFKKEKETNQKVKQLNKMYAEFLKSQMTDKKQSGKGIMNDEEYRMNRELMDEIDSPAPARKNFLI